MHNCNRIGSVIVELITFTIAHAGIDYVGQWAFSKLLDYILP